MQAECSARGYDFARMESRSVVSAFADIREVAL